MTGNEYLALVRKITKKRNFACTSSRSYQHYKRMIVTIVWNVFMVSGSFKIPVVLDSPLYETTHRMDRKGAWSSMPL
jgi:hypothetical protein